MSRPARAATGTDAGAAAGAGAIAPRRWRAAAIELSWACYARCYWGWTNTERTKIDPVRLRRQPSSLNGKGLKVNTVLRGGSVYRAAFLARAGSSYGYAASAAGHIDSWRSRELPVLVRPAEAQRCADGEQGIVYLDHAGAALPLASQLRAVAEDCTTRPLGNPHSAGPAAGAASAELDRARSLVLAHFCGSHAPDWEVIWTAGATASLRLVAEHFQFCGRSALLMPSACHTSCNLTGDVSDIRAASAGLAQLGTGTWWLMLDAAKAAATGPLHLHASGAALCAVSFYKLFGSPTGLGTPPARRSLPRALLVRRDALRLLRKDSRHGYFGGGSVAAALPHPLSSPPAAPPHAPRDDQNADGTAHYLGVAALARGFEVLEAVGGPAAIAAHTRALAAELRSRLRSLRHADGRRAVVLYGAWAGGEGGAGEGRAGEGGAEGAVRTSLGGPTVAFNVVRHDGSVVGYAEADVLDAVRAGKQCGDERDVLGGRPTGVVRASLGKDSSWEDVDALLSFLHETFVLVPAERTSSADAADAEADPRPAAPCRVLELFVHPLKSCGGMRVRRWPLDPLSGRLLYDREWGLAGTLLRSTAHPRLALLRPELDLAAGLLTESLTLCGEECYGAAVGGPEAALWFERAVGVPCRLVRCSRARGPPLAGGGAASIGFANEAPLLLVSQESVETLSSALRREGERPVGARSFRPNIVVGAPRASPGGTRPEAPLLSAAASGAEDGWTALRVGGLRLRVAGPCARCSMVEVDPASGARHGSVLRTLATYRRSHARINFGVFCELERAAAERAGGTERMFVEEGDEVEPVARSPASPTTP
ncbi:hypothetical protein EMIHUDRAFT_458486 [Emiliania huxleyi CCMP1516]|uniref:MOSC domain-containing protein n=2 Tax=Emiliania huxleyi TaxID=2903 RepID=A0A0D3JBG1_EMIH1|nr:hypothetical protein EMIHUDRAFT_458486 [Emiliania huxleyi CCMP1516]EOD20846.1 hypothetical protein EMIHUDRAFT_458486 [Emiliania huxleyi CCMP1516]|eukprot:XP_005773275.1 hypothetical protein EMIHUDRAFT_458486 [Emiliania huxleyi CCMP1516]